MEDYVGGQLNNINLIFFSVFISRSFSLTACCERSKGNTIEFLTHLTSQYMYNMSKIMLIRDKKPNLRDMRHSVT